MKTERKIYREMLRGERGFYLSVIFVEIITYTFSFLVSGLAKKDIFNLLEGKQPTLGIYSLGALILLNVAVPLLINCVKQVNAGLVAKVEVRLKRNVKMLLLDEVLNEKMGVKQKRSNGETVSLFRNECEDCADYLLEYYRQLPKIVLCTAILVVMIYSNPIFALISLIPTAGMVFFTRYLEKHIVTNREKARRATGNLTEFLENILGNVEYFKLVANSDRLGGIFGEKCRNRAEKEVEDRVLDKALGVVSENSASLVLGIVLLVSIPLYRRGAFSVGEFVMFEYYYAFLESLPDAVGKLIRKRRQTKVSADRIEFEQENEYAGKAAYAGGVLSAGVECGGQNFSISGHKGEVLLFRGGTENERSLLLQRLFQVCLDNLPDMRCGYIPQQPVLFNGSVQENICFGEEYQEKKLLEVLRKTDLLEDVESFEEGLQKSVGKQGTTISGGQKKRISIARALYSGADILFIDGLAESVDKKTELILISNILELTDKIVLVASNSEYMLEKATQVISC